MEKVTIIVPTYNVEKYLSKCLESLISQTFKDISIWVIIDGSPDDSIIIAKKYQELDGRIKVIDKENGGYGSVLEYAINHITTDYFLICDPDDWLEEEAVEKLYNAAVSNNADFVVGDLYKQYLDGSSKYCKVNTIYNLEANILKNDLFDFAFISVSPHSKLYKTKFVRNIDFPHKISYTDGILYFVNLSRIDSAYYIDQPLSNYYIERPGNSTSEVNNISFKSFSQLITVYNSILDQVNNDSKIIGGIYYLIFLKNKDLAKKIKYIESSNRKECRMMVKSLYNRLSSKKNIMYSCIKDSNPIKRLIKKIRLFLYL